MKKIHIVMLVAIAAIIAVLISMMGDLSTYETIASARQKQGKAVTIIARLDKSMANPIQYDPVRNANFTTFHVVDSLGNRAKVEYHFEKPFDMEKSERIVLKGTMKGDVFEITRKDGILIKCPSKYKDEKKQLEKSVTRQ